MRMLKDTRTTMMMKIAVDLILDVLTFSLGEALRRDSPISRFDSILGIMLGEKLTARGVDPYS